MMYTTIWIVKDRGYNKKCVFKGSLPFTPRVGDYIVVREGFCAEEVSEVIWDVEKGSVCISLGGDDYNNEYGDCVFNKE